MTVLTIQSGQTTKTTFSILGDPLELDWIFGKAIL